MSKMATRRKPATRRKRVTKRKRATQRTVYKRRTVKRVAGGWPSKRVVPVVGNQLPVATPVPSATPVSKSFFSRFRSTPPLAEVATVSDDDDFAEVATLEEAMRQNSIEDRWREHQRQKTDEAKDAWEKRLEFEENRINQIAEINFVDEQIEQIERSTNVGVGVNADKLIISSIANLLVQWHKIPRTVAELNNARLDFLDGRHEPLKDEDEDEDEE